jgi:hypothetical protein
VGNPAPYPRRSGLLPTELVVPRGAVRGGEKLAGAADIEALRNSLQRWRLAATRAGSVPSVELLSLALLLLPLSLNDLYFLSRAPHLFGVYG